MTFSLSVPLKPSQVPAEMQADPGVTSVCWARQEASEKAEANTGGEAPNSDASPPGRFTEETAA